MIGSKIFFLIKAHCSIIYKLNKIRLRKSYFPCSCFQGILYIQSIKQQEILFININFRITHTMERQVVFSNINAKYVKDFDTFGKMDPFLVFTAGKCEGKTETAEGGGKEPSWKNAITLNYFDEQFISVKSWEEDTTSNEYMGEGRILISTLENSGKVQVKIDGKDGNVGTVFAQYRCTNLPAAPMFFLESVKCSFYKKTKFLLSSKPYFQVESDGQNMVTEVKDQTDSKSLEWSQKLRIKMKQGSKINFNLLDKNDNGSKLFSYQTSADQFSTVKGQKCFNVNGKDNQPLGTLGFSYSTLNWVSQEESEKNAIKQAEAANSMTAITLGKIKGSLKESGEDVYFKILCGPNLTKTKYIQNAKKDFVYDQTHIFYAEPKENKITFAMYDKDLINDDCLGKGILPLKGLANGQKKVDIINSEGKSLGFITIVLTVKEVKARAITFTNITAKLTEKHDIIGKSEPYVISRMGGWSTRTETGDGQEVQFKKNLHLKFSEEDQIKFEVWDEDINDHDKICQIGVPLSKVSQESGHYVVEIPKKDDSGKLQATISFKYQTQNVKQEKKEVHKDAAEKTENKIESKVAESKQSHLGKKKGSEKKITQKSIGRNKQETENERVSFQEEPSDRRDEEDRNKSLRNEVQQQYQNSRSRDNFKLPSLRDSKNYGDKIFDKQSSATLQRSILVYSMPKAPRFGSGPKYSGEPSYYVDSSFKRDTSRGAGFGFGGKMQFPSWMERNMKENPSPNNYFDAGREKSSEFRSKGPTFGIGHKHYQKVTIPKEKKMSQLVNSHSHRLKPIK